MTIKKEERKEIFKTYRKKKKDLMKHTSEVALIGSVNRGWGTDACLSLLWLSLNTGLYKNSWSYFSGNHCTTQFVQVKEVDLSEII